METNKISYSELAKRVGDCILNNEIHSRADEFEFDLINGKIDYCNTHETEEECRRNSNDCEYESVETYQEYIITKEGAKYLQKHTDEIVFYCESLGVYLWGITHFGTSWNVVFTTLKE